MAWFLSKTGLVLGRQEWFRREAWGKEKKKTHFHKQWLGN